MLVAALGTAASAGSGTLVRYGFDDQTLDTGPATFAVREKAKGRVSLSRDFRFGGHRSLSIEEVAGDGDFAELQGWFPVRREGPLFPHFALLVADPREELNIALAGPAGFGTRRDGIALWLTTRDGHLAHVSDSIVQRLVRLDAFTWYRIAVAYDVGAGRYDLAVAEERRLEPILYLRDQPNAASRPGSAVDRFSFIGDLRDRSRVRYWVDDVVISAAGAPTPEPLVAPGRRKLFFDAWLEARAQLREGVACPPSTGPEDFGLDAASARALRVGRTGALAAVLRVPPPRAAPPSSTSTYYCVERGRPRRCATPRPWPTRWPPPTSPPRPGTSAPAMPPVGLDRLERAEAHYRRAVAEEPERRSLILELSDVAFARGDFEGERSWRERVYGTLRPDAAGGRP